MSDLYQVKLSSPNPNPIPYEHKRVNRWVLTFPDEFGIPEWSAESTSRPKIKMLNGIAHIEPIKTVFRDPIGPSTTQALMGMLQKNENFDYYLEMLDPTGVVVEKWLISDCEVKEIDFGILNYDDGDITKCVLIVKPSYVELIF